MSPRPPVPTGGQGRPLVERLKLLAEGPITQVRRNFEEAGDLYSLDIDGVRTFVTRHPDHIYEVLVRSGPSFEKNLARLEDFLGKGLLTAEGEHWRRHRRLIQPAFQKEKIKTYAATMTRYADELVSRWRPGLVIDLGREMSEVTLRVVSKTLLDHEAVGSEDTVAHAITVVQDTSARLDPFPAWVPTPSHLARKKAIRDFDRIVFEIIDGRAAGVGDDLVSQLKAMTDQEGGIDRKQLRDEIITLFLAGHETTAQAMTWVFFLLAGYPDEEQKLHAELDRELEGRPPTFEDLPRLERTRWIFQEALRMFPPLYLLLRYATADVEVGGYVAEKGTQIMIWSYFTHRDARWFPEPNLFDPGRWAEGSGRVLHPHAYLPFGLGSRTCIGRHFATVESTLLLATIAQRYRLRRTDDDPVHLNPRLTLGASRPIRMRLEPR